MSVKEMMTSLFYVIVDNERVVIKIPLMLLYVAWLLHIFITMVSVLAATDKDFINVVVKDQ